MPTPTYIPGSGTTGPVRVDSFTPGMTPYPQAAPRHSIQSDWPAAAPQTVPNPAFYGQPRPPVWTPAMAPVPAAPKYRVRPTRPSEIVIAGLAIILALVVGLVGFSSFTQTLSTVTDSVSAIVAPPSENEMTLRSLWRQLDSDDQGIIRDAWSAAKGNSVKETLMEGQLVTSSKSYLPTLTKPEARKFFEWTLKN